MTWRQNVHHSSKVVNKVILEQAHHFSNGEEAVLFLNLSNAAPNG